MFLDSTHFLNLGCVNWVQSQDNYQPSSLIIPERPSLDKLISETHAAKEGWNGRRISRVHSTHGKAEALRDLCSVVENFYSALGSDAALISINSRLVVETSQLRRLTCLFAFASAYFNSEAFTGGYRLVDTGAQADGTGYPLGCGKTKYYNLAAFEAAGPDLVYTTFQPSLYPHASQEFVPSLSGLDAVVNLGFEAMAVQPFADV